MNGFGRILAVDADPQTVMFGFSGTLADFICSPFDTPKGPDGVIFSSEGDS
jgi:hypothetical protein